MYIDCFILYELFFVFKQKTAYESRISDWSSDVCSSDLVVGERKHVETLAALQPNSFRVAGNEKILAFHIVVQMRFDRMRVAHLFRIGPFAISEGEIRRLQDRRRRIEQGFVIFGDHHVANADQDRKSTRLNSSH